MLLRTNDAELFYKTEGKGPDVILLHPFPSCHEFWIPVQDKLAAKYRLIMPDLRGLGESGVGDGNATMQKHAEDLVRLCDELKVGKAVFIGCSIGGYILFEFWRKFRERMAGLVLANTKASADNAEARAARLQAAEQVLQQGPEQYIDGMLPKLLGEITQRNRPEVVEKAKRTMMRSTAQGIAAVQRGMAERPDSTATLSKISIACADSGRSSGCLKSARRTGKNARWNPQQYIANCAEGGALRRLRAAGGSRHPAEAVSGTNGQVS